MPGCVRAVLMVMDDRQSTMDFVTSFIAKMNVMKSRNGERSHPDSAVVNVTVRLLHMEIIQNNKKNSD